MLNNLKLLDIYSALARHSAAEQSVRAENIANADQPGYKSREIESFGDYLERTMGAADAASQRAEFRIRTSDTPAEPNGNTVNLEYEALRAAEAAGQHDMAVTVYSKSLDLLRTALGRRQ